MHLDSYLDQLETEYGTAILSKLTGQSLTRNGQSVRLFDETKHSAEVFYKTDEKGKPYVHNFQLNRRFYPVTAYSEIYGLDFSTALTDLCQQYGLDNTARRAISRTRPTRPVPPPRPVEYLPVNHYELCRIQFHRNGLYEYLRFTYGPNDADEVFDRYRLGTSRYWRYLGYLATCMPQFDIAGNLRQVKIMIFDAMNGRRVKDFQQAEQWNDQSRQHEPTVANSKKSKVYGKYLFGKAYHQANLIQCFFGEHLLTEYPDRPVAIVEGESTAIICSILWPQYVWLATGGSNGARWTDTATFGILRDRNVVLWPDNDAYTDWSEKAIPLRKLVRTLRVTSLVSREAPVGMNKADLRDLLMRPRYTPTDGSPAIFGELLSVEQPDQYPLDWD